MSNSVDTSTSAGEATSESDNGSETRISSATSQSSASMLRELVTKMQANDSNNNHTSRTGIDASLEESLCNLNKISDDINMVFEDTDNSESQSKSSGGNSSTGGFKSSHLTKWIEKNYNPRPEKPNRSKLSSNNDGSRNKRAGAKRASATVTPSTNDIPSSSDSDGYPRRSRQHDDDPDVAVVRKSCGGTTDYSDDPSITLSSSGRVVRSGVDLESMKRNADRTERLGKKIKQVGEQEQSSSSSIRLELEKKKSGDTRSQVTATGVLKDIMASSSDEEDLESASEGSASLSSLVDIRSEESTIGDHGGQSVDDSAGNVAVGMASISSMDTSSLESQYNRKFGPTVVVDKLPVVTSSKPLAPRQPEPDEDCEPRPQVRAHRQRRTYPLHQIPEDDQDEIVDSSNAHLNRSDLSAREMEEMLAWYQAKEEMQDKSDAYYPGIRTHSNSSASTCSANPGGRVNSNSSSMSPGARVDSDLSSRSRASGTSDTSAASNFSMSPYQHVFENDTMPAPAPCTPPLPQQPPGDSHKGEVVQGQRQVPNVVPPEDAADSSFAVTSRESSRSASPNPDSLGWEELGLSASEREALHRYELEKQAAAGGSVKPSTYPSSSADVLLLEREMIAMQERQSSKRSVGSSDNGSVDWAEVGLSKEERQQMHSLGGDFIRQQVAELARYELHQGSQAGALSRDGSLSDSIALELSRYEPKELEKMSRKKAKRSDPPSRDSKTTCSGFSNDSEDPLMVGMRAPSTEEMAKEKKARGSKQLGHEVPGAYHSASDNEKFSSVKDGNKSHKHKAGKTTYHKAGPEKSPNKVLVTTGAQAISSSTSMFPKSKGFVTSTGGEDCYVDLLHEEPFADEPISGDKEGKMGCNRRKLIICCASGWVLALIALAFMMGALVMSAFQGDSSSDVGSSSLSETLSKVAIQGGAEFDDPDSYQSQALAWLQGNADLSSYSDSQKIQRWVLASFYFSTTDLEGSHTWAAADGWLTNEEECTWKGVVCDGVGRSVVALELPDNRLEGVVPPEISLLSASLVTLNLHNNRLANEGDEGHSFFQELTNLRRLNIGSNDFVYDGVPLQFAKLSNLHVLDISNLKYAGELRGKVFSKLPLLKALRMGGNQFVGSIPMEIGNIESLEYLHVENAGITGDLSFTKSMSKLFELRLDQNPGLTGTIPSTLGDIPTLGSIVLAECSLTGPIPSELGRLSNMELLWLLDNYLTGTVPTQIGSLSNLRRIGFSVNELSGSVPEEICLLKKPPGVLVWAEADCFEKLLCGCCDRCF